MNQGTKEYFTFTNIMYFFKLLKMDHQMAQFHCVLETLETMSL